MRDADGYQRNGRTLSFVITLRSSSSDALRAESSRLASECL